MVGNLRKIVTFYIIKGKLHGRTEIRNLSSRVANISLVRCAHSWNIFQHSKINFLSPRGHIISSISLPSPPPEIQVKNKIETGDGSGYTLEFMDTLIHWIISMQRKLTFFPNYNSGRNHWILNSVDIKIIAISSDEERNCFECSAVISDGDLGLMDHLKKEHCSSEVRSHVSSSIQRNVSFLSFLSFPLFLWWMYACVFLFLFCRGGAGRAVSNNSLTILWHCSFNVIFSKW